jgi:acetyltransferase-like isoleucine patch superfamily enzyme
MFTLKQILLHLAAEIEVLYSNMGDSLHWRRRELRGLGVVFGEELWIGRHLFVRIPGNIALGERLSLGQYTQLYSYAPIVIGDDFTSASNLTINTGTHDPLTLMPRSKAVRIGDRVWCGMHVTILSGVTIGDDVVVGAGSVVTRDVPPNAVVAGVPARIIHTIDRSELKELWTWAGNRRLQLKDRDNQASNRQNTGVGL